ncbi:alpha/beta fold hydrolase [Gilvimarinus chinensis]|uniref:alpha/beta fold hydrolase n=1 Tax=Gilvimarinus chinensis TaxID=396005 RepID=UPI0003689B1A|nr:alpha/beta hydrolase [Gilvimarinus chinensis]
MLSVTDNGVLNARGAFWPRLAVVAVLSLFSGLLVACDSNGSASKTVDDFALQSDAEEYEQLITQKAETLSTEQLYSRALTLWGGGFQELRVPTSYGVAQVVVAGPEDGYPVVLLHGMNTNSTMWYPNASELAKHFRIYAIDYLLGPGKSKPKPGVDELKQVLDWYGEVFVKLQLERFALVGASQGGWFATQLALKEPQRLSHLVLLSPAQTFSWIDPSLDLFKNLMFAINPEKEEVGETLHTMSTDVDKIDPLYIDQFYRYASTLDAIPALMLEMRPFEREQFARLTIPTLVLIGDEDIINSQDDLSRAKQVLHCVSAHVVESSGHFLNVDAAESVNSYITRFVLDGSDAGACELPD